MNEDLCLHWHDNDDNDEDDECDNHDDDDDDDIDKVCDDHDGNNHDCVCFMILSFYCSIMIFYAFMTLSWSIMI